MEKVVAKCRNSKNCSSRFHTRSECFFNVTKVVKKYEKKAMAAKNFRIFYEVFNPEICKTRVELICRQFTNCVNSGRLLI